MFAPADPHFPESRPEGAFDGSAAPPAAAMLRSLPGQPATLTVALDQPYRIDRIGLMLAHGRAQDADVLLSVDGQSWSAPLVSVRGRTDYALGYADIAAQEARYVRIQAPEGGTLSAVTELELYSDVDSFENDPVLGLPRGFTDAQATATRVTPDPDRARVEFAWATGDFRGAFMFDVRGRDTAGTLTTPWHFNLNPVSGTTDATLRAYDGVAWRDLGRVTGVGSVEQGTTIAVDASPDSATVTIGGQTFTTAVRWQAATRLSGVTFASAGTAAYGMEFFIDDLVIR